MAIKKPGGLLFIHLSKANWGSSTEAQKYQETVTTILNMSHRSEHIKSYNPQILVMAGKPYNRPALLDIGHLITNIGSFMIVAEIESGTLSPSERQRRCFNGYQWIRLHENRARAFFVLLDGHDLVTGSMALMQTTGLGRLSPNLMLLGYVNEWYKKSTESFETYFRVIQNAFANEIPVAILRVPATGRPSKDWLTASKPELSPSESTMRVQTHILAVMHSDSDISMKDTLKRSTERQAHHSETAEQYKRGIRLKSPNTSADTTRSTYKPMTFTHEKYIDAWWLYDDGGLNILLPYIIARRSMKEKTALRIFALTRSRHNAEEAKPQMENLLSKLRIEYTELTLVEGLGDVPAQVSWDLFNFLIANFKSSEKSDVLVSETELQAQQAKISRHLRLREMLLEHSSNAALIVMTLPHPRTGAVSAALYMAWLEALSKDLPPMLFVRGNDSYVLDL